MVKVYLSRKGFEYTEFNVSENREALKELVTKGYRSTPVTVIGEENVVGYSPTKLDEALEALVSITTSIINCERGTIFLNDTKSEELYSRVAQGNFMREIRFMNTKGVAGWAYTNKEGAIVHDAYKDDRFNTKKLKTTNNC